MLNASFADFNSGMKRFAQAALRFAILLIGVAAPVETFADDYTPPKVYSVTPTGVNLSDGSLTFTNTDLSIGPLALERFHLGGLRDPNTRPFGPRMSHNFDIYVSQNVRAENFMAPLPRRYAPVVHIGNSSVGVYMQDTTTNAPVYYSNRDAQSGNLTMVGGAYVFTAQDGTVYNFSSSLQADGAANSYRATSIVYPDGRTQSLIYSGTLLKEVVDSSGYALIFDYSGGNISAACVFNLSQVYVTASSTCAGTGVTKVSYGYTSGHLTSVTDVLAQVTNYGWSGDNVTCIKPPGYSTCKISTTYVTGSAEPYRVSQQTLGDGSVWNYAISGASARSRSSDPPLADQPDNSATVTDPAGKVSGYSFFKGSPSLATDPNGNSTTYLFTGGYESEWSLYNNADPSTPEGSLMVEVEMPEHDKYLAEYDGPFNLVSKQTWRAKPASGLADRVRTLVYGSCTAPGTFQSCIKPMSITDPKGNETNYSYTSWGGVVSEMQPSPVPPTSWTASTPAIDKARPLKLYDYVQKYAYIKNSGGTLVAAATPIWVPNSETLCQTVAGSSTPTCDTAAPITVTTFEYGANGTADNLLLRGKVVTSGGVSLRTCYGYGPQANKIWETSPRGTTSASCS